MALALCCGSLNVNRAGETGHKAWSILSDLRHRGVHIIALQETSFFNFERPSVIRLGWRGVHSTCKRAAVIFRSSWAKDVAKTISRDRMTMVILRSGVCFTSLYIKDSNYADAVGACRKLLGTVRTELRNAAK